MITNLQANPSSISDTGFELTWDADTNARYYLVYIQNAEQDLDRTFLVYPTIFRFDSYNVGLFTYQVQCAAVYNDGTVSDKCPTIEVITSKPLDLAREDGIPKPLSVSPSNGLFSIEDRPTFTWQTPSGNNMDFVVEIAEDPDFTKNVRHFNSFNNKEGFSFQEPVNTNEPKIVGLTIPELLTK